MPISADASNSDYIHSGSVSFKSIAGSIIEHYHDYPCQTYLYDKNNLLIGLIDYVPYEPPYASGVIRQTKKKSPYIRMSYNERNHKSLITSIRMGETVIILWENGSVSIV